MFLGDIVDKNSQDQKSENPESPEKNGTGQAIKNDEDGAYEKRFAELSKIAQDYKDTLQRLQAEFENAAKRTEREREDFRKFAGARIIEEFIPLADSIDAGLKQAEKSKNAEMQNGFEMLRKQFTKVLGRNGVHRIETTGKKFDHSLHEALMTTKDETKEDDIILEEFSKGYTMNGKMLRPSKVKINRKI